MIKFAYQTWLFMFKKEIQAYEALLKVYRQKVTERMATKDLKEYNEILFSANSCAIEGNSFSVNDTRELKEKGLASSRKERLCSRPSKCSTISVHTNFFSTNPTRH